MNIRIDLNQRELSRLVKIQKTYQERGIKCTLSETLNIIAHTHIKAYLDQRLDEVEEQLFVSREGKVHGAWK